MTEFADVYETLRELVEEIEREFGPQPGMPALQRAKALLAPEAGCETDGAGMIASERARQIAAEGWTPLHDDSHTDGELVRAAVCYLAASYNGDMPNWPWDYAWWKPSDDPVRNLTKAGALIAAEIDRCLRGRPLGASR